MWASPVNVAATLPYAPRKDDKEHKKLHHLSPSHARPPHGSPEKHFAWDEHSRHEAAARLEASGERTTSGHLPEHNGSNPPAQSPLTGTYGIGSAEEPAELSFSGLEQVSVNASAAQVSAVVAAGARGMTHTAEPAIRNTR